MRIISQDGTIDVLYKKVAIQRCEEKIYFLSLDLLGTVDLKEDLQLAEYSTGEKAEKAMETFHSAYMLYRIFISSTEEDKKKCEGMLQKEERGPLYGIFRFPSDDEIEV